jgi:hypothetical protein
MNNWLEVIDKIKYLREYDLYEYEDERPSEKSIMISFKLILKIKDGTIPMRVAPCGDNGLAFEWKSGNIFETIYVINDEVEHVIFKNCKVVDRYKIEI